MIKIKSNAHALACKKLKEGMRVMVIGIVPDRSGGWDNSWNEDMRCQVGKIFIVEGYSDSGVIFKDSHWGWPAHALVIMKDEVVCSQSVKVKI